MAESVDDMSSCALPNTSCESADPLIHRFLRHSEDAELPTQPAPQIYTESLVTPLIDGAEYAKELARALHGLGAGNRKENARQSILISGWWLGLTSHAFQIKPGTMGGTFGSTDASFHDRFPFCLDPWPEIGAGPFHDPPNEKTALLKILKEKARAGVDVRVLGWVNPALARRRIARQLGGANAFAINTLTMRSLISLRAEPAIGAKAVANIACHTVGSSHSKIVIINDGNNAIGFTGGIDLQIGRWARPDHFGDENWHDIMAKIEGPAIQSIYDHFRALWNANVAQPTVFFRVDGKERHPSKFPTTQLMPDRIMPVEKIPTGQAVQEMVTYPAALFSPHRIAKRSRPLPAAPQGQFTYRAALCKAILAAKNYIYIEDQLHWSPDVMAWLNQALSNTSELRVILLLSGREDPNDPRLPHGAYLHQSLNNHLIAGLTDEAMSRIAAFRRAGITVHAKTVIIDDAWAAIGSCNIAQRSLYTDIEHGVSFVDNGTGRIRDYRASLWAHHFRQTTTAPFQDLATGLAAWRPDWATANADMTPRPPWLVPVELPVPEVALSRVGRWLYESYHDCDSRERWSGLPKLIRKRRPHS